MFSFYKLVEALDQLEEDRWMKRAGIDPSERYAKQWKRLVQRSAELRQSERGNKSKSPYRPIARDSFRNAQVMKKLSRRTGSKTSGALEEFYLDPSLRPSIRRLAKSGTEIKDPVQKKKFFGTIRVLALQRQKAAKAVKTSEALERVEEDWKSKAKTGAAIAGLGAGLGVMAHGYRNLHKERLATKCKPIAREIKGLQDWAKKSNSDVHGTDKYEKLQDQLRECMKKCVPIFKERGERLVNPKKDRIKL